MNPHAQLIHSHPTELHRLVKAIKFEIEKLQVRHVAVQRIHRQVQQSSTHHTDDEHYETLLESVETLESDISYYITQLRDRLAHIEQGLTILSPTHESMLMQAFVRYVTEDARLCVRDIETAREAYDDLIENLTTLMHETDS